MNKKRLKGRKRAMYEALRSQLGIVTTAAEQAGIGRTIHYKWLKIDENYKQWIEELPEITLDFTENALLKQIKNGNITAIIFYLKTKGKHRGYIERPETLVNISKDNKMIQVNIPEEVKELMENGK